MHLQATGGLKAVTKDLWSMVNDFAQLVKPDLSDYEADGVSLHNRSLIVLC